MRYLLLCLALTFTASLSGAQTHSLQPFETDNCTFFMSGPTSQPGLWKHCCFEHDLRYWFGGALSERDISDGFLKQCVQDVAGPYWATLIYRAVMRGHNSPIQHRLHWGWGWTPERSNRSLSSDEKALVRQELFLLNLDRTYVNEFILRYQLN
ncbi:hypothetical protein [Bdellovibrio sp. HCB337]|uniref:hypothetical protein n=1 Tax=Bdellovibrio sp. HCB337 TaxID=3394358 RepID=UPI0039A4BF43